MVRIIEYFYSIHSYQMTFLSTYESHFTQYLSPTQFETLRILLWLLTVHKQVRIERLAACFPLPILYQSRRKHALREGKR